MIGVFGGIEHSAKAKADFKKRPAVKSVEVSGGAFYMVINFQCVGAVGDAFQFHGNLDHALTGGQLAPVLRYRFASHVMKLGFSLKSSGQR